MQLLAEITTVIVTNAGGCSGESVTTTLTINNGSNVAISPANATITCGSPTTLTASNAALYQWLLNGATIPGANIQTYAATQAGQYSVQVIDIFGCPSTSAAITVSNGPPIASVMDTTVYLDANGNVNISINDVDNGTVANCPNGRVSISPTSFDCSNLGSNTVTVTVTDANGNSDTAFAIVTVIDSTGPLTILQPGTIYLDSNGQAIVTVSDINNGTSDACGIASTSVSPINFDCSNLGQGSSSNEVPLNYIGFRNINHRSYGGGFNPNTNQFHFPEWSGNQVYITDPISGALIQTKTLPTNQNMQTWIDNSSTDVYSANWSNNTISRYDGNTVVWSYNVGTLAANITTDDNYVYTQPYNSSEIRVLNKANGTLVNSFNLPGRMIVYGGLVYSNDKLYIFGIAYFGNVQGTWNAVHTFDAANGNYLQSQSLPHPTFYGASFDGEVAWIGNGSRIEGYQIASGSAYSTAGGARNVVAFSATDVNGNTSYDTTFVSVVDTIAPIINSNNTTVYLDANGSASVSLTDVENGSTDNCAIEAIELSGNTSFNCSNIGANSVTITATDSSGNTSTSNQTVTVLDTIAPVAVAQNISVYLDASRQVSITAADINGGSTDNCSISSIAASQTTFDCNEKGNVISVTLTVTDQSGNVGTAVAQVSVLDTASFCNQAPVAVCQNITIYTGSNCDASIVVADVDGGSSDPDGDAITYALSNSGPFGVGTYSVSLTVNDGELSDVCTATVTVQDTTSPTAVCQNVTLQLDASGQATILGANSTVNVFNEQFQTDANAGNSALLNNWNVLAGNVDVNNFTSGTGREIDMGGNTNATIETKNSITLVPGDYEFSFHHQTNSNPNPNNQLNIQIGSFLNETFPAPSSVQQVTRLFTVTTATTVTIRMQELGTNDNSGTFIGDINLSREVIGSLAIENGSSDDCGIASITASRTSFTCSDIGTNNVTLTVTDVNGNSSTCVATVTVEDNISPIITCSPNITVNSDAVTCGTVVNYTEPTATDNCGFGTGGGSNVLIIWDVINANTTSLKNALIADGLNVTMSATSEYQYNGSNPSLSGFDAVIHLNGSTYGQTMPLSGQNALVDFVINQGKTYITEEWSAYEIDSRNAMTAMRDIVVLKRNSGTTGSYSYTTVSGQAGHPILSGLSNSFTLPTGGSNIGIARPYSSNPATVLMTGTTIGDAVVVRDFANGGAAVAFAHAGNYANLSILSDANVQKLYINAARYGSGSTAITQIAGLPAGATFPIGTTVNTFVAVDSSGNSDTCTFNVTVNDVQAPNMVSNSMTVVLVDRNTYTLSQSEIDQLAANSSDNCVVNYTISNHGFDCSTVGQTVSLTLTGTDASSNSASVQVSVTVTDPNSVCNDPPVAACQNITLYTGSNCDASIAATDVDGGSSDPDGDVLTYTVDNSGAFGVGTHTVTLTVSDGEYSDACTATVTVLDSTAPITLTQNVTVQLDANGNGSITTADIDNGSNDACGIASLSLDNTSFTCANVGANTVTLTSTDVNGNSSSATATVTVEDNVDPITLTQNVTVQLDANGNGSITTADIDNGSNDACGIANLVLDVTSFNCSNVGANTVILTSTDVNGNSSSASATVTVEDNVDPITLTQNVTVQLDANGNGSITTADIDNGSNDACGIASLSLDNTSFTCANVGANTVTLTSTDVNGNSSSATATVTVEDNVDPITLTQNVTVQLDANGNGSITNADIDNGSNDACGIANLVLDVTSFNCSNVGANTVILTSTDVNGNSSSASATVTVEDNVDPITLTQNVTVQLDANGNGSITTADIDNGSNDACGIANLALDVTSFDCSNVGANTVILTSTDVNGNSSSATATVTVEDNVNPITLTQNVTVQLDANGNGSITTADIDNGSNDACGIANLSLDNTSFTCANVGANTVILTSTDVNGNSSSASATVTVEDNVDPITLTQNVTVQLDANGNGSITTADIDNGSNDACGIANLSLDNTSFTCANVGANTVILTSTDVNGNSSSASATVTVEDNVDPITLTQNVTVQLDANGNGSITTADIDNGSNDACGIAILSLDNTSFTCANVGANTVILTSTDVNGNSSSASATVTVEDNVNPITLTQNVTVQLDANGNGSITTADIDNGSNDACGIANLALDVTSFDCSNVGANTVILTSTDVNGNSSSATATVTVEDNVDPITLTQNVTVQLDANGNGSITTADIDNGSNDACGIANLSLDNTSFTCANVGANTVILTSTDVNGNSSSASATVTVEDNVDPITLTQNVTVQLDASGNGSITTADIDNGSNDACGIANLALDVTSFDCSNVGANTVILTSTDVNGNSSSASATVTVEDNVNPIALCQNVTVTLANGVANITPQMVDNGSNDACGIANLSVDVDSWDCNDIGDHPVVLTVTDNNGNSSTCNAMVTVVGEVPTCSITSIPTNNTYTGGVNTTLYLGYGAQSTVLDVAASGGSSFTYAWTGQNLSSTTSANPTFTPTAEGNYTFDVVVTNEFGCETSCSITICVRDIRVRKKNGSIQNGKVYLCHVPPGKPNKTLTLSISVNAVASHLTNHSGDALGVCGSTCNDVAVARKKETTIVDADDFYHNHDIGVILYPNPTKDIFNLEFDDEFDSNVDIEIRSINGKLIRKEQVNGLSIQGKLSFDMSNQANGIYFISIRRDDFVKVIKFSKM